MANSPKRKSTSTYHTPAETPSRDSRHRPRITGKVEKAERTPLFDGRKSDVTEGKGKSLAGTSITPSDKKSNEEKGISEGKKNPEEGANTAGLSTIPHLSSPEITEEETSTHNNTSAPPPTPTHVGAVNIAAEQAQQAIEAEREARSCIDKARKASKKALEYAQRIRQRRGTDTETIRAAADAARIAAEAVRATVTYAEEVAMASSAATLAHGIAAVATNTNDASAAALQVDRATKTATDAAKLAQAQLEVALSASQAKKNDTELKRKKLRLKNMPNILALMGVIVAIEFALKEPSGNDHPIERQLWSFCYASSFINAIIAIVALSCTYSYTVSRMVSPRFVEKGIMVSSITSMINCLVRILLLYQSVWMLIYFVGWCMLYGIFWIMFESLAQAGAWARCRDCCGDCCGDLEIV